MAQEPPRRDEPTIFEVTEYDWYPAHNEDENLYPKLNISSSRVGFGRTLEEAEELMRHAVEKAEEKSNDIYCFHIKEFPIFCKVFQRRRCTAHRRLSIQDQS